MKCTNPKHERDDYGCLDCFMDITNEMLNRQLDRDEGKK